MQEADLQLRSQLMSEGLLSDGYNPDMRALHEANALELDSIIDEIGYPTIDKVGKEASDAAWLIIQHAISLPSFMKRCEQLLADAVANQEANPILHAYLHDRIAIFEGRLQSYGTQFDWNEDSRMCPQPYDDLTKVNARRKALGLNSLEEQTILIQQRSTEDGESPPQNHSKKIQQYNQWRIDVGWI